MGRKGIQERTGIRQRKSKGKTEIQREDKASRKIKRSQVREGVTNTCPGLGHFQRLAAGRDQVTGWRANGGKVVMIAGA